MAVDLSVARRQLSEALGDYSQTYWNNMKLWYKQKISKEDFDAQAKKCLGNDNLHFHNEFLLAILAKCQALGSSPAPHPKTPQKLPPKPQLIKKGKIKKQKKVLRANFEQRFAPCDPLQNAPQLSLKDEELSEDSEIGLCSYDLMLPDSATIYGRLFLGAWDAGLDSVADETVNLMLHATEYLVKDILTVCCSMRSNFRLRDGHFRYAMGGTYPRMHLRNSTSPWPPGAERQESSRSLSYKAKSFVGKCEREFRELKQRADKYFDDLDKVEEMCQRAKQDVERIQLEAQAKKEIAKRDAVFQANLYFAVQEMTGKRKRMKVREETTAADEKGPEPTRNAERDTLTGRVCRYVKIGCSLVFDAVAVYGLFKSLGCVNGAASSSSNSGRTLEQAEAEAAVTVASSDSTGTAKPPISLMDLRDALQVHRRVIPSHTVYSANIERTLANMCHPGHDELEQNQLHKLEARRRYERLKQQRSLSLRL
ncbi:hypothetical protein pdam_00005849 [Pocillopora damicornis]|uniref:Uncharacterized protein n=1 Tax=Pocillopora damicornis TaxID=46731 RepID=A0A3M6U695_POCDA|nr:hypothetical protein pdam_00005849 [Pocillopora damicornis]